MAVVFAEFVILIQRCFKRNISKDRHPGTTACPDFWPMGTHKIKKYASRKKKCTGLTSATKAG
jgi:hypothetical protein